MTFAENLMELRRTRGYSQEELGDLVGVTRQTVSKWELGLTTPEMEKLLELSRLFGVSIDSLAGAEEACAPQATQAAVAMRAMHREYKSRRTLFGLPLVHINVGYGLHRARGIIAVGNFSRGIISIGITSCGVVSVGALSAGIFSLGGLSLGLLLAFGGLAIGALAVGGIAVGLLAIGGVAVGIYSIGGLAVARDIAMGGFARGHIAIGDSAVGPFTWEKLSELTQADHDDIRATILREFPGIWRWIVNLFC